MGLYEITETILGSHLFKRDPEFNVRQIYSVDWILYCSLKAQAVTNIRSDYIVKSLLLLFLLGNTSFS